MSSKDSPILGPRNAGAAERAAYQARDLLHLRGHKTAVLAAGLAVVFAGVGKTIFKSEMLGVGSAKKAILSFVIIGASGMAANEIYKMRP